MRVAFVSGANRGIGREIATRLARDHGFLVLAGSRAPEAVAEAENVVAVQLDEAGAGILVNSMCPGWVRTELGGPRAPRSVQEDADTAVWLATLPAGGPSGGFYRDREPIPW